VEAGISDLSDVEWTKQTLYKERSQWNLQLTTCAHSPFKPWLTDVLLGSPMWSAYWNIVFWHEMQTTGTGTLQLHLCDLWVPCANKKWQEVACVKWRPPIAVYLHSNLYLLLFQIIYDHHFIFACRYFKWRINNCWTERIYTFGRVQRKDVSDSDVLLSYGCTRI
jgi:hypothetical protein